MISHYRIKAPIRAILQKVAVMLPVGAILEETSQHSTTLFGMVSVAWGGRHYSVYPKDLYKKAERVSTA